jgi:hypothetical protein
MAENKKSFVLYTDYTELFNSLSDANAGQLIKHIFNYVNDTNPTTDNEAISSAFILIKMQLKRDLVKWKETRGKRSEAGKISAESRKQQKATLSTHVDFVQQTSTKSTVSVNDNVTVNDTVKEIHTHDIFKNRLLESEADLEAVGVSAKRPVIAQHLISFNANLKNSNKHHSHYGEYKKHLVNWLRKQPIEQPTRTRKILKDD